MAKSGFQDFSFNVKAELNETTIAWLYETASEIASQAQRGCKMDGTEGQRLRGSYKSNVDESEGKATIGSALESVYWEEFGTGEYAAHKDGRKGWWVYVKDGTYHNNGGQTYTEDEAKGVAASMRADGLDAYATNGREPNYTLEKAFDATKEKAKSRLEALLKERMDGKNK